MAVETPTYVGQVMDNIGNNVLFLRKYYGMSQKDLARKSGQSMRYISNLEHNNGDRGPSVKGLIIVAKALNTTAERLIEVKVQKTIEQVVEEGFFYSGNPEQ